MSQRASKITIWIACLAAIWHSAVLSDRSAEPVASQGPVAKTAPTSALYGPQADRPFRFSDDHSATPAAGLNSTTITQRSGVASWPSFQLSTSGRDGRVRTIGQDTQKSGSNEDQNSTANEYTIWIPSGTCVVLGSLDARAGSHLIEVSWKPTPIDSLPTCSTASSITSPEAWDVSFIRSSSLASYDFATSTNISDVQNSDCQQPCNAVPQSTFSKNSRVEVRSFSIPYFTECGNSQQHCEATMVASGLRTRVYLAEGIDHSPDLAKLARSIVELLDSDLRSFIEERLGEITDVDHDQHLTVVLGSLSTTRRRNNDSDPINGCVRADDFLNFNDEFGGDIIYMDVNTPTGRELTAVLAHELAHTAVFSIVRRTAADNQNLGNEIRNNIPSWLNEAIAHYIEHLACPGSQNLAQRIQRFSRTPNAYPLVVPDEIPFAAIQRGPMRAAGCLFLQSTLRNHSPTDLRSFVKEFRGWKSSLEKLNGQPFKRIFRDWSVQMAYNEFVSQKSLSLPATTNLMIRGTSFCCFRTKGSGGVLKVAGCPESCLQLTFVEPYKSNFEPFTIVTSQ